MKPNLKDISNSLQTRAAGKNTNLELSKAMKREEMARHDFDSKVYYTLSQARNGPNDLASKKLAESKLHWKETLLELKAILEEMDNVQI